MGHTDFHPCFTSPHPSAFAGGRHLQNRNMDPKVSFRNAVSNTNHLHNSFHLGRDMLKRKEIQLPGPVCSYSDLHWVGDSENICLNICICNLGPIMCVMQRFAQANKTNCLIKNISSINLCFL